MFPPTDLLDVSPHSLALDGSGSAPEGGAEAGLSLTAAAHQQALVVRWCADCSRGRTI